MPIIQSLPSNPTAVLFLPFLSFMATTMLPFDAVKQYSPWIFYYMDLYTPFFMASTHASILVRLCPLHGFYDAALFIKKF